MRLFAPTELYSDEDEMNSQFYNTCWNVFSGLSMVKGSCDYKVNIHLVTLQITIYNWKTLIPIEVLVSGPFIHSSVVLENEPIQRPGKIILIWPSADFNQLLHKCKTLVQKLNFDVEHKKWQQKENGRKEESERKIKGGKSKGCEMECEKVKSLWTSLPSIHHYVPL